MFLLILLWPRYWFTQEEPVFSKRVHTALPEIQFRKYWFSWVRSRTFELEEWWKVRVPAVFTPLPGSSHTGWWALLMQALCLTFHPRFPPKPVNVAFVCLALFFRNKEVMWIFPSLAVFSSSFAVSRHLYDIDGPHLTLMIIFCPRRWPAPLPGLMHI